jgi:hypothetical protein
MNCWSGLFCTENNQEDNEMRVFTRGDMDGLTSVVLLSVVEDIGEVTFAHPKTMQDGSIKVNKNDIIINLPYVPGCGMWFDHHISEEIKIKDIGPFKGNFAVAPSTARVIFDFYKSPKFAKYKDLLEATDRMDSGRLTIEDVINPSGWILIGLTLDPRSGLGMEFREYFRRVVDYVKQFPLEKVLENPDIKNRCQRILQEQDEFKTVLKQHSHQEDNVIITDFRETRTLPAGNRFLVYTLYPEANVEVRLFPGVLDNTVVAIGHSIFNRTCKVNIGKLMAKYDGGGHLGAGTCQLPADIADIKIAEIIKELKKK